MTEILSATAAKNLIGEKCCPQEPSPSTRMPHA